ncbi:hypothetical protein TVAG_122650 [Trichomonas vaginalis G3]|uniref:DUF3447 domain-containing protein n=1 Tax=Trichomonas vaginalis (strain ATCC PRA-98 / G3) TaxID=412133 RepID=A2DN22_TRIV3|nr:protein of unknown function (DUF3447) [Trichomonas vaginalis G3]EAY18199.1 hypothetical protein TVAG_122650 [Trichomonas vaginalis G3]KAI5491494.1 protein of unknown function (DUF3447) [Trichomonas vaginalis G3]|eukprot:XP_001579185.1 hypothetical protein [Trichomonas vaginalis G3]
MSDLMDTTSKYDELRGTYKYYIDLYIALFHLKTEKEEELISIYKLIKTELIDSTKYLPKYIMRDILRVILYNNRYAKSYLFLAKLIYDDYHVSEVDNIPFISNYLFNEEYQIKLDKSQYIRDNIDGFLDIHTENTIYRAIMLNDVENFIFFTEREGFNKYQNLQSCLYPFSNFGHSLPELCCYHGAVDCFKLLRTKFNSRITPKCLEFSFLGGNQEIMSECLKYQEPDEECMKYAILSHNIDFVTFLMNEYEIQVSIPKSCTEALRASIHHLAVLTLYKTGNVYFTIQP